MGHISLSLYIYIYAKAALHVLDGVWASLDLLAHVPCDALPTRQHPGRHLCVAVRLLCIPVLDQRGGNRLVFPCRAGEGERRRGLCAA